MVNSAWYCVILDEELKPAIHSKNSKMLKNRVILHLDNALSHMAVVSVEMIQNL